mgnify:CR=1 FL=1
MATRTTMRSRSGTKLYAVRDESGQFKDIQTYKRAHSARPAPQVESREGGRAELHREESAEGGERYRQVRQELR